MVALAGSRCLRLGLFEVGERVIFDEKVVVVVVVSATPFRYSFASVRVKGKTSFVKCQVGK